jgi:hypothetical protein
LSFALAEFPSQLRLRDIGDLPTGTHRQFGQPFGEGLQQDSSADRPILALCARSCQQTITASTLPFSELIN